VTISQVTGDDLMHDWCTFSFFSLCRLLPVKKWNLGFFVIINIVLKLAFFLKFWLSQNARKNIKHNVRKGSSVLQTNAYKKRTPLFYGFTLFSRPFPKLLAWRTGDFSKSKGQFSLEVCITLIVSQLGYNSQTHETINSSRRKSQKQKKEKKSVTSWLPRLLGKTKWNKCFGSLQTQTCFRLSFLQRFGTPTKKLKLLINHTDQAPVVQKADSAIHWINRYPV